MSLVMDDHHDDGSYSAPFFSSSSSALESSPLSTGYLEDALIQFGSKRRRLMFCNDDHYEWNNQLQLVESYWNSDCTWGLSNDFSCISQINNINEVSSSDEFGSTSSVSEEANILAEIKTPEEAISCFDDHDSTSYKDSAKSNQSHALLCYPTEAGIGCGAEDDSHDTTKTKTRVVYPFAVVKPGGVEGVMTLNDINRRILMRPTRPVRHPVGDFACRPRLSPEGAGISGKAVVALTRIQTHGKGTITIIRTKG